MGELPFPPLEMRTLVGPTELDLFDNPSGRPIFPFVPANQYRAVFDFGCGCGRLARQLIQQTPRPERYLGVDLHRGMIRWCRGHLRPHAPAFEFAHLDVFQAGFHPEGSREPATFPCGDHEFSLVIAWSVFTHVLEEAAEPYLREVARILEPDGVVASTWFLFDKAEFPMMQESQNALYINHIDPSNAVIFDRCFVRALARSCGLVITEVIGPPVRGFQWTVLMKPEGPGTVEAEFPPDSAPIGVRRAAQMPAGAERIGLD